ncbi:abc transporter G family [Hyphodiscus hymeniophilus]|uniref:Abc transporter G family n=1 Tax=Hyphodiscus hymeniophilus TaxID=353542 RepID=A0A9P7AZS1_9HELO|nr:abc transporter G family [Hyphodiscus hymeniophilus]
MRSPRSDTEGVFYKNITDSHDPFTTDIELQSADDSPLMNHTVKSFLWKDITVTVKDHKTKQPKSILDGVDGLVEPGEICALMGPSGCGKTTLLNVLAHRDAATGAKVEGHTLVNGTAASLSVFRTLSSYVEQEDALIGSLTVRETLHFAARLAHKNTLSAKDRKSRIEGLLDSFGLRNQSNTIIGTPIQKGISGGQKRRVSVASQLITGPKILFLDEPTSGLDSAASLEVVSYVKKVAKKNNLIVIASIHQPSTSTFELFDKLVLLSGGKQHYFGPVDGVGAHFELLGFPMPRQINPAEFLLEMMNIDFASHQEAAQARLNEMHKAWITSPCAKELKTQMTISLKNAEPFTLKAEPSKGNFPIVLMTLVHRAFVKSYRDVVAYGIRIAMYTGLAIMMGTVWLRLHTEQDDIQPFINAIFFGSAFMSFMAVAYVPSYLEDRATFVKERYNGLYGSAAFIISNFIIGLPYLFLITLIFSSIAYWLSNFQPTAHAFFSWIMWLFLDLVAAESLVVLMSSIFPNFVISLALTAFANGLWMSVGGFLVTPTILNVFWKYVFHYIDYQSYVFQGMMVNEFQHRTYGCGADCRCIYESELSDQCRISGTAVLDQYGYKTHETGKWVGILLAIVLGYRLLGWAALCLRK